MKATIPLIHLFKRLLEENISAVLVTKNNVNDLMEVYEDGQGEAMGIKKPEIGDVMDPGQLLQMAENANNLAGKIS